MPDKPFLPPAESISVNNASPAPQFPKSSEIIDFIKKHEKLVGLGLLLVVGWFGYGRILNYWEKHDQRVFDTEKVALQAQVEKNKAIADANATLAADYKVLSTRAIAQAERLTQSIMQRDASTKKQQETDRTLPPGELALRWQELIKLPPLSVAPQPDATFSVTPQAAVETVVMLEEIPKLQGHLKDTQTMLTDSQGVVVKGNAVIAGLNTQVDGLNKQIVNEQTLCKAEVALVKTEARRGKRKWFIRGLVVAGTVLGILKYVK